MALQVRPVQQVPRDLLERQALRAQRVHRAPLARKENKDQPVQPVELVSRDPLEPVAHKENKDLLVRQVLRVQLEPKESKAQRVPRVTRETLQSHLSQQTMLDRLRVLS